MARSVLIAGDSNLKQLVGLMSASVLCVPGARIVNDRKFFQEQLSQRLTTDLPELVVLHLGSNDAGDKVSDLLVRNYRKILDSVFEALPSVSIGVTEVLPRRWNGYVGERANRKLSGIQENICQLNVRLRAMTKEYRDCRFIEYGAMFDPDSHLAVDGLHVNRAGALVLKDVLESSIACRGETVSEAIETHVLSPVPAELGKLSYADVVRFFPPRAVHHSQNHSKSQEKEEKPPVFETFFRQQNILLIKTRAMKSRKFERTSNTEGAFKKSSRDIVIPTGVGVAAVLPANKIYSIYKTKEKEVNTLRTKPVTVKESPVVRRTSKLKKVYPCPDCPVICSREDFLLDHLLKHFKRASPQDSHVIAAEVNNNLKMKREMENIQNVVSHTGVSDMLTAGLTKEIKGSNNQPTETDNSRDDTCKSNTCGLALKNLSEYFWKNFSRLKLLLSGDIETNPGPVMIKCLWGQCSFEATGDVSELITHLISHITGDSVCLWNDCCFPTCYDEKRLQTHVLQHVYLECFKFKDLEEWVSALPSKKISRICTDLHLCPPELRCQLGYVLFDEDFKIPKKFPYTPEDHEKHLLYMEAKDKEDFKRRIDSFLQKREALGENWTEDGSPNSNSNNSQPNITMQNSVQTTNLYCVGNPVGTDQSIIHTNRPELTTHNQRNVVLKFVDERQRIKRKYQDDTLYPDEEAEIWKSKLITNLDICRQAISVENEVISNFFALKFIDQQNKHLHNFEEAAISIATYPDCTEGVLLFSIFEHKLNDQDTFIYYIRYLESGYYQNFMTETFVDLFCAHKGINRNCVLLSNILTREDILQVKSQKTDIQRKTGTRPDKRYNLNLKNIKETRLKLVDHVKNFSNIKMSHLVHCVRHKYKANVMNDTSDKCYLQCDLDISLLDNVREKLRSYPEKRIAELSTSSNDFLNDIPSKLSLLDQSIHINLMSNDCNRFKDKNKTLRFIHRFSVSKSATSLRNSVLHSYKTKAFSKLFNHFSSIMTTKDCGHQALGESLDIDQHEDIPIKKRKKSFTPRAKVVTKEMINKSISRQSDQNLMRVNIYESFKRYLISNEGTLIVQVCNEDSLVVVMNDYDDETGAYKEADYVKTTRHLVEDGYYYTCTCKIYRTLLECVNSDGHEPYDALDMNGVKCMHCRFLKDEFLPNMERKDNATCSVIQEKVQRAFVHKDEHVIELPTKSDETKKFSVLTDDDQISFVHLSLNQRTKRYIISCMNGFCKSKKGSKKNVNSLSTECDLCVHIKAVKNNPLYWSEFLPAEDKSEENQQDNILDTENAGITADNEVNIEVNENNSSSNFNVDDGMWCFPCESTHSPLKPGDPLLANNSMMRIFKWIKFDSPVLENGCMSGPDLIVDIPDHLCPCGKGWSSSSYPEGKKTFDRLLTVYTANAPVSCKVYSRNCLKEQSPCKLKWDEGQSVSVHVVTKETAAGDEIGWDYVNLVMSSSVTFSSYCSIMTKRYQTTNPAFRGFMDQSTFRKWWFSWASSMKIDFRKPCPVCKYTPKQLACDGTKVGVGFRHASFDEINKPDNPNTVHPTLHRRMTRCFLSDKLSENREHLKTAREHLHYLSSSILKDDPNLKTLSAEEIQQRNAILLSILNDDVKFSFQRFLLDMPEEEKVAYAVVMKMLSTTAPVSSLIPHSHASYLKDLLDHLSGVQINPAGNNFFNLKMKQMREYAPEVRDLIGTSMQNSLNENGEPFLRNDILLLLYSLINLVNDMETIEPDPAIPQFESYNPPKYGRAYYFSENGRRLRPIRKFEIDEERKGNRAYDDAPSDHDICEKYFSKTHVAARGTSTLFLWFCPNHGHCYGFHMTNAEGRKDPAASLYSYLETPPNDIFYDFACNLHEYCLNRESGYYKDVRFFHDIFHGFSHKCSTAYRSSRLLGFETINSEICEQFNSFIQCIKASARQMTQEHFCFYLQFFLHQWNEKKETKFQKRMTVALAGL